MSTAVLSPPLSVSDLVRSLSVQQKTEVFNILLRELVETTGPQEGTDATGDDRSGWREIVPETIDREALARFWAEVPPSLHAAMQEPVTDLDDCIPMEEFLEQLRRADEGKSQG